MTVHVVKGSIPFRINPGAVIAETGHAGAAVPSFDAPPAVTIQKTIAGAQESSPPRCTVSRSRLTFFHRWLENAYLRHGQKCSRSPRLELRQKTNMPVEKLADFCAFLHDHSPCRRCDSGFIRAVHDLLLRQLF